MVKCKYCSASFTRSTNLKAHINRVHNFTRPRHICIICKKSFISLRSFSYHKQSHKPTNSKFRLIEHGLHRKCEVYQRLFYSIKTTGEAYTLIFKELKQLLRYKLLQKKSFKCQSVLLVEFIKMDETETVIEDKCDFYARSSTFSIYHLRDVKQFMRQSRIETEMRIDDFISHGSGWRLNEISALNIEFGQCRALTGGCNLTRNKSVVIQKIRELNSLVPTNAFLNHTGINEDYYEKRETFTSDNKCFLDCIAYYFLKRENNKCITKKRRENFIKNKLNVKIKCPVKLTSISKFEKDNAHLDFKINVLHAFYRSADKWEIYPLISNPYTKCDNIINLLYFDTLFETDDSDSDNIVQGHFLLIDNIQHFLNTKIIGGYYRFICSNCLQGFGRKSTLTSHEQYCFQFKPQVITVPMEWENTVKFKNFKNQFFSHFIGFFDFEAILKPPSAPCVICAKKKITCVHKTKIEHEQIPISFSIIITDINKKIVFQKVYTGEDCMSVFINTLLYDLEPKIMKVLDGKKPLKMSANDEHNFQNSTKCHICHKYFSKKNKKYVKVRDHNHITGHYLGAAHQSCNLNRQEHKRIPLFCHNFSGYDTHFIMKSFTEYTKNVKLECLPYNTEKFRVINLNNFILLDSANFLNASLDVLSNELQQLHENSTFNYPILDQSKIYHSSEQEKKDLILRKGFFPYEYLSDVSKLNETKFPSKTAFASKLKNDQISDENYQHAKTVYKTFHCETFRQYMELYCLTDTLLLAEIVWLYREEIMTDSGLDIW